MAKKKVQPRRVPRAAEPRMYGDGKPSAQAKTGEGVAVAPQTNGTAARPTTAVRTPAVARPAAQPFRPPVSTTTDYTYVLKDLRRLGVAAAGIFAVLVALGLIIR